MSSRKLLQQAIGLTLVVLLLGGCGGAQAGPTVTAQPLAAPSEPMDTPAPTLTLTLLPPTDTPTPAATPTPTVTPTPQVQWIPVKGGENLIQDAFWECVPGVDVVNGKLVITTGSNYQTPVNQYGPHLEIHDDFGVSATIEAATNDLVAISLFGALPQGEWWQGIKRLDVGISSSEVSVTIWDGTKPTPATSRSFRASGLSRKVQLELRKVGSEFIVRANGVEVGRLDDPRLFIDGKVYLGVNVAPRNQLTVHSLSALAVQGREANVQISKPWITVPVKGTPGPSLRSLAQARGIRIGAAVAPEPLLGETLYAETLGREFNILTTESAMKFEPVHPSRDHYTFCYADAIVAFAKASDMQVRGHTLVWHHQLPGWLTEGNFTRDELEMILQEHIFTVVGRFRGQVTYWDVVNEAVADDGSLRDTIWLRGIGPEYIDLAFRWAHEADPQARLFYNDYGGEGLGPKSDAIYSLVQGLLQRGVPIHGVGLQMHISLGSSPKPQDVVENMNRLGALGLEVHITELDVRIEGPVTEEKLAAQASIYCDLLEVCLSAQNCKAFVLWGFTDRHSWIPQFFPGSGAALIFDESYHPKPAYNALIDVLSGH